MDITASSLEPGRLHQITLLHLLASQEFKKSEELASRHVPFMIEGRFNFGLSTGEELWPPRRQQRHAISAIQPLMRALFCPNCQQDLTVEKPPAQTVQAQSKPHSLRLLFIIIIGFFFLFLVSPELRNPELRDNTDVPSEANTVDHEGGVLTQSTATPTPKPGPTPTPTPTLMTPLAPPFGTFQDNYDSMTDAQWESFASSIEGTYVNNWEGIDDDVEKGEILDGYTVEVRMDEDSSRSPVYIDVPDDLALSFNREQRVRFSGRIRNASNTFSLSIPIEDTHVIVID